jgi:hypothetical protein
LAEIGEYHARGDYLVNMPAHSAAMLTIGHAARRGEARKARLRNFRNLASVPSR